MTIYYSLQLVIVQTEEIKDKKNSEGSESKSRKEIIGNGISYGRMMRLIAHVLSSFFYDIRNVEKKRSNMDYKHKKRKKKREGGREKKREVDVIYRTDKRSVRGVIGAGSRVVYTMYVYIR